MHYTTLVLYCELGLCLPQVILILCFPVTIVLVDFPDFSMYKCIALPNLSSQGAYRLEIGDNGHL